MKVKKSASVTLYMIPNDATGISLTNFFHPEIAKSVISIEDGYDSPVIAMNSEAPPPLLPSSDKPVAVVAQAENCDVEMEEGTEINDWLSLVNHQPTSLSWEERISQEELALLDEYPPAEKMEHQSSVGMLSMRLTHW